MSDPLFPFGYGLSYTTFETGTGKVNHSTLMPGESLQITIPVTNTGEVAGTEVLQVYTRKVEDHEGPLKTLRGFQRIDLAAGESGQVVISLPASAFEFYNQAERRMMVSPGEYELYYGNSSDTEDLKMTEITIQ
jgi:beta-glucosidase